MSDSISITPLTPAIGAEIGNVDLRAVSDYQIEAIRAALLEHQVIFFRDQELDQEQHIAFARHFTSFFV